MNVTSRTANLLLEKICDDLNPESFSREEILEEGLDGIFVSGVPRDSDEFSKNAVTRALDMLIEEGSVEKIAEDEYRVIDPDFALSVDLHFKLRLR